WLNYVEKLKAAGAEISLIEPKPGLPDFVFTANAGIVRNRRFIPARFRFQERQGEEPLNIEWFVQHGFEVLPWPQDVYCEGAGTALFMLNDQDQQTDTIFVAKDFRSDAVAADHIRDLLGIKVVRVELSDPRFYHLDTCFCPLPGERAIWYPTAFTQDSQKAVRETFAPEKLFAVNDTPAEGFACNAVHVNGSVFMNSFDAQLEAWLQSQGFTAVEVPLWEFLKAGGAAKCLTLRINH
ncbi:MAG TPA: arginine deiminase-related protein, partial [Alphaproteobacteria bacterium]|nr:arginine deiminase-related protein [Alphaproteobacteria bacterium]